MGQVRQGGLREQHRAQDINAILPLVLVDGDILQQLIAVHASVVDQDINLELAGLGVREVVLGRADQVGGPGGNAHVGLDDEAGHAVLLAEGLGELLGDLGGLVGRVVDDQGGALGGEVLGYGGSDSCGLFVRCWQINGEMRKVLSTDLERRPLRWRVSLQGGDNLVPLQGWWRESASVGGAQMPLLLLLWR